MRDDPRRDETRLELSVERHEARQVVRLNAVCAAERKPDAMKTQLVVAPD
jgi:hypothetical protein